MDETQPLLGHILETEYVTESANRESQIIDFNPNGDPENPMDWSPRYKSFVVFLLAVMAFTVTFTCIGVVPIASQIIRDLTPPNQQESKSASILLVTVWELGEAAGPLLIAPLSEIYGRYPIFNIANLIFILSILLAALSRSVNLLIFSRFLTGLAVASNVLNPAIIGDIFPAEKRGSGMAMVMLAPLLGGAVGPAIAGLIAERVGWRCILWISAILAIICEILIFLLLRETYKVPILRRRAARLRRENGDESLKCAWEVTGEKGTSWNALRISITRPILIMWDSLILKTMSFYGGLIFTFYYVVATTLPGILGEGYGFSPALTGSSFLSFSIGATGGIIICNLFLDSIYIKLGKSQPNGPHPEYRLPIIIGGGACIPLIVFLYGWAPSSGWPVWSLLLIVAVLGTAMITITVPLSSYIVDAFGLYSASAMTGVLIARCLLGTLLPLAIPPLVEKLGLGYGFLVLAGVCGVLIPLPVAVLRYGEKWRRRSVYTRVD